MFEIELFLFIYLWNDIFVCLDIMIYFFGDDLI